MASGARVEIQPVMTTDELNDRLSTAFEQGRPYEVVEVGPGRAKLRLPVEATVVRPGGTVSGPTLMMLADAAAWVVVLAHIGWVPLAVTSSLSINFLRKPEPAALDAEVELRKLGRRLAVTDVCISSMPVGGDPVLVADASVTYAIPAER
ncbi:MAG: PaaI family thioesterase [Acidimicrobiia bacterium]|nr:PaaI family thioesterase [Acidimicrobiia bacterium]